MAGLRPTSQAEADDGESICKRLDSLPCQPIFLGHAEGHGAFPPHLYFRA
jgi:hypothetical protein